MKLLLTKVVSLIFTIIVALCQTKLNYVNTYNTGQYLEEKAILFNYFEMLIRKSTLIPFFVL